MYYVLRQDLNDYSYMAFTGHTEESGKRLWINGIKFDKPFPEDTFYVVPNLDDERNMPDFFDTTVPVMSKRMLVAMRSLGVDNIDAYPVIIQDKESGETWKDYFAVNVVGLLDAIDLDKSVRANDYDFHSTVIDEKKAMGQLCFRLLVGPEMIIIHESVAKPLMEMGLKGVLIIKTEDYDQDDY